jgi:D-alanyl-D-alanine carboxypeptidase/D-alanyl-D-alanine-endopeptidase (penicillin-binding protein 4)
MKNFLLLLFLIPLLLSAQNKKFTTANELEYLTRNQYFKTCQIGVDVFNITKKKIVFRHNEKLLFRPASNMKILTTATALRFLGPEYKFKTELKYNGNITNGVLNGDIYFIGGFDPDFTSADLDTMILQLREIGVKRITGNLYADVSNMDSLFWGNGWMWDDDPSSDFPYMTPLIINDICVNVAISPSKIGEKANVTFIPNSNYFKYTNNIITVDNDTTELKISRDWINRSDSLILEGGVFVNSKPDTTKINFKNSTKYFLTLAKETLAKNNITLEGRCQIKITPENVKTITTKERTYKEVIVNLNKTSDNLSAEMSLRALAFERHGKYASAKEGIKEIDSLIVEVGLNPETYRLVDGSGVSHYNLVSVELLNETLIYMHDYHPELFEVLYNSFPIAGVDGSLKYRMRTGSAHNNVHAKTGTLSGVSSLSGYVTAKNGDLISFSINTQNFVGSAEQARSFQDKICEILANIE